MEELQGALKGDAEGSRGARYIGGSGVAVEGTEMAVKVSGGAVQASIGAVECSTAPRRAPYSSFRAL